MRQLAVTLAFAVLSLAFAPVPLPKAERPPRETPRQKAMRECSRRLELLGVSWRVEYRNGELCVCFSTDQPEPEAGGAAFPVTDGDLAGTLQKVAGAAAELKALERAR